MSPTFYRGGNKHLDFRGHAQSYGRSMEQGRSPGSHARVLPTKQPADQSQGNPTVFNQLITQWIYLLSPKASGELLVTVSAPELVFSALIIKGWDDYAVSNLALRTEAGFRKPGITTL